MSTSFLLQMLTSVLIGGGLVWLIGRIRDAMARVEPPPAPEPLPAPPERLPVISKPPGVIEQGFGDSFLSAKEQSALATLEGDFSSVIGELTHCLQGTCQEDAQNRFARVLQKVDSHDIYYVRQVLGCLDQPSDRYRIAWTAFWRRWCEVDISGALDYLTVQSYHGDDDSGYDVLFEWWGKTDLDAARQWLDGHAEHPGFERAKAGLARSEAEASIAGTPTLPSTAS